jgi:MFS family permease
VGEICNTAIACVFAALVWFHLVTSAGLLLFSFLVAAANALTAPAWQAVVTLLVPKSDLPQAVAANSVGINASRAVGPALGGALLGGFGAAAPFCINAVSNIGIHETPAMRLAASAVAGSCANPNSAVAAAVPNAPAAAIPSGPRRSLSQGSAKAPATAETPIAPSKTPYSVASPPIWERATSGNKAQ